MWQRASRTVSVDFCIHDGLRRVAEPEIAVGRRRWSVRAGMWARRLSLGDLVSSKKEKNMFRYGTYFCTCHTRWRGEHGERAVQRRAGPA
jgi:hypothetical protein